jgi:hypothetical protein
MKLARDGIQLSFEIAGVGQPEFLFVPSNYDPTGGTGPLLFQMTRLSFQEPSGAPRSFEKALAKSRVLVIKKRSSPRCDRR